MLDSSMITFLHGCGLIKPQTSDLQALLTLPDTHQNIIGPRA